MPKGKQDSESAPEDFDPTAIPDIPDADEAGMAGPGGSEHGDDAPLYDGLPHIPFEDVIGRPIAFLDATVIPSQQNKGTFFVVFHFRDLETGEEGTTRSGGVALVDRLRVASETGKFPFKGRIRRMQSERSEYKFLTIVPVSQG